MSSMNRAEYSEATFNEAKKLGRDHGIAVSCVADGCYQMRHASGWIINMYPRRSGCTPRMYHDPHHRGPFLDLPQKWTLLDAVKAAIKAIEVRS